jgi:hypothetical protein
MKNKLHPDGKAANYETNYQNDEDGRPIATIDRIEILTTNIAGFRNIKKALKKLPLSASRAFAGKPGT